MDDIIKPMGDQPSVNPNPLVSDSPVTSAQPVSTPTESSVPENPTNTPSEPGASTQVNCQECGTALDPNSEFCKACGAQVVAPSATAEPGTAQTESTLTPTPISTESSTDGGNTPV